VKKLRISTDLRNFYLHDGGVNHIQYLPSEKRIIMGVELTEDGPKEIGYFGQLIFDGVRLLEAHPPLESIDWNQVARTEISTSHYNPEHNQDNLEAVLWFMDVYYYDKEERGHLLLEFLAEDFEWHPDLSKDSPYT
jgi:hypothetical protein